MAERHKALAERLRARFGDATVTVDGSRAEVGIEFEAGAWQEGCRVLRDEFGFEQLIDLCGVDTLGYGTDEWDTGVSSQGYSRGVVGRGRVRALTDLAQHLTEGCGLFVVQLDDQTATAVDRNAHHDAAPLLDRLQRTVTHTGLHRRHSRAPFTDTALHETHCVT